MICSRISPIFASTRQQRLYEHIFTSPHASQDVGEGLYPIWANWAPIGYKLNHSSRIGWTNVLVKDHKDFILELQTCQVYFQSHNLFYCLQAYCCTCRQLTRSLPNVQSALIWDEQSVTAWDAGKQQWERRGNGFLKLLHANLTERCIILLCAFSQSLFNTTSLVKCMSMCMNTSQFCASFNQILLWIYRWVCLYIFWFTTAKLT